ncbi:hypothetical protein AGIG_G14635 [Arapaima gigas]
MSGDVKEGHLHFVLITKCPPPPCQFGSRARGGGRNQGRAVQQAQRSQVRHSVQVPDGHTRLGGSVDPSSRWRKVWPHLSPTPSLGRSLSQ